MDIYKIRQDFPLLREEPKRKAVIYLDNACQSLRPDAVIRAVEGYYVNLSSCGERSMHHLGEETTHQVEQARSLLADFVHAKRKEEIVFTRNTTEGINLVAYSLELKAGDVVLISGKEHNSNLIPWQMLVKRKGIKVRVIPPTEENLFDMEAFEKGLNDSVKMVAMGWTSNLDGVTIPAKEIIKKAHASGALVLLDGAQTAPHYSMNVRELDVDFLAFSGHKMLGPSGTGVLFAKYQWLEDTQPFMVGGDTVSWSTYESCEFLKPPGKFEAGLQNYAGIIGLGEAVKYLQNVNFDFIQRQEKQINTYLTNELKDLPNLKIIGPSDPTLRSGIFTFYIDKKDSHQLALMLDQMAGIMVRSGQHCVHSWFAANGITGSVRISAYFYNTIEDAELLVSQIKKIIKVL